MSEDSSEKVALDRNSYVSDVPYNLDQTLPKSGDIRVYSYDKKTWRSDGHQY